MLKVQALNRHQIAVVWLLFGTLVANKVRSMKNNETVEIFLIYFKLTSTSKYV